MTTLTELNITSFNQRNVYYGKSPKRYGNAHFARRDIQKGEIVMRGFGELVKRQTAHFSIQIGFDKHFLPTKWTGKYWNHSCEPNTYINTRSDGFPDLIAMVNLVKGEEITYGYYMTEYEWAKNAVERIIRCQCGTASCTGQIRSFSQLSDKEKLMLQQQRYLSKYLQNYVDRLVLGKKRVIIYGNDHFPANLSYSKISHYLL